MSIHDQDRIETLESRIVSGSVPDMPGPGSLDQGMYPRHMSYPEEYDQPRLAGNDPKSSRALKYFAMIFIPLWLAFMLFA